MSKTFADLGIPFSLYEGPVDRASTYCGIDSCSLCGAQKCHCFRLDIGCAIILPCPTCGTENGLDTSERNSTSCRNCHSTVPFPRLKKGEIRACYSCLRAGKAAITKYTELGMISWEQAFEGVTHGVPGLNGTDFEMVPQEDDWVGAKLPKEHMYELLRTPNYSTIQGERWQFCCQQPMVFVGEWDREMFSRNAPDRDGRRFFEEIVQDNMEGLWEDDLHDETGVYVFRCRVCHRMTAHWDIA